MFQNNGQASLWSSLSRPSPIPQGLSIHTTDGQSPYWPDHSVNQCPVLVSLPQSRPQGKDGVLMRYPRRNGEGVGVAGQGGGRKGAFQQSPRLSLECELPLELVLQGPGLSHSCPGHHWLQAALGLESGHKLTGASTSLPTQPMKLQSARECRCWELEGQISKRDRRRSG